jgi:hypothetical protein
LLSSEPTDELRSDTTSSSDQGDNSVERKIASMYEQLVSDRAVSPDTKKAAECVKNYAKRIRGFDSAGLFSPATETSEASEHIKMDPLESRTREDSSDSARFFRPGKERPPASDDIAASDGIEMQSVFYMNNGGGSK